MSFRHEKLATILADADIFTDGDWVESKDQDPDGDVRLIQLADIGDGEFLNKSSRFLTSSKAKQLRCTFIEPGDVLIARMPDPLGRACIFPGVKNKSVTVVDVCIVRPNRKKILSRFLMHALNSNQARSEMLRNATGTTRQRISRSNLGDIKIPLPSLSAQERITTILDETFALRMERIKAITLINALADSIFIEMFGDPIENPKGWDVVRLGDDVKLQGGFAFKSTDFVDQGAKLVKISNVHSDSLSWDDLEHLPLSYVESYSNFLLKPGDIVLALTRPIIKSLESVKIAVVSHQDTPCLLNQRVGRFQFSATSKITPQYLLGYCRTKTFYRAVETFCSESLQPNMSTQQVENLKIPVPPGTLQMKYSATLANLELIKNIMTKQEGLIEELFSSLQSQAFSGEL